jgi:hypothetical protein
MGIHKCSTRTFNPIPFVFVQCTCKVGLIQETHWIVFTEVDDGIMSYVDPAPAVAPIPTGRTQTIVIDSVARDIR